MADNTKQQATVIVQFDSGGKLETHELTVGDITRHVGYWHGFVTFRGERRGVYNANKSGEWNLDLF